MSRPLKEAYGLSDAEKRDLIQLIQQGKPLPEQYRFVLFEDKREVELVWNVAVKVIDIFGNDTMTLMPISVG